MEEVYMEGLKGTLEDGPQPLESVRCGRCGLVQSPENHYCISCGAALYPEEFRCSFCGYPLETSWEYCPMCGGISLMSKARSPAYLLFEHGYKLWLPSDVPEGGVDIGREKIPPTVDNDSILLVSRRHFKIYTAEGDYFLEDLGSTNGTMVDGMEIEKGEPIKLEDGAKILIAGRIMIVFKKGGKNGK